MQQPMMNGNPVQILAHPMLIDTQIRYRNMKTGFARQLIGLGIAQLIIGVVCFIFQAIALANISAKVGLDGFWIGIIFLITGPFGIVGGFKRSRCHVIAFNVFSILSASFAPVLIIRAAFGAMINATHSPTGVAIESLLAILGLIEFIIAIWSSVICCSIGACCCDCGSSSPNQNRFLMTDQHFSGQQQVFIANQQQAGSNLQPHMFVPNQQQTFLPNSQQPMTTIDPRPQWSHYDTELPNLPPYYGQESSAYTALSQATRDQASYVDLYTGLTDTPE